MEHREMTLKAQKWLIVAARLFEIPAEAVLAAGNRQEKQL